MKKLFAALLIALFIFVVGCQESSNIVAPDNDASDNNTPAQTMEKEGDDGSQDNGQDPGFPRI